MNPENLSKRADTDFTEFRKIFPEVSTDKIPEEVWKQAESGIPLEAAYALYDCKMRRLSETATETNRKNEEKSIGNVKNDGGETPLYTLDELKQMSPADVRKNYAQILKNLEKCSR